MELAKDEINRAQTLDPQLAETHLARSLLLWSGYEGYQNEAAVRELLLVQQLNPNVGHAELASLFQHIGLEDLAARELQRALDIDPTSELVKRGCHNGLSLLSPVRARCLFEPHQTGACIHPVMAKMKAQNERYRREFS